MLKHITVLFITLTGMLHAQNPGDVIFNSSQIHTINIEFGQPAFWDSLLAYKQFGDNIGQDVYMRGKMTFNGIPMDSVGVRLKGNSTFGHPGMKKPVKIQFNEYVSGQELDGLRSIHLNNSSFDPTMLREKIFLDILNRNGIPAPRCTYARLSYNGQYVGLYKIVEPVDKRFLQTHFGGNDGNLYKGDPNGTLEWQGWDPVAYYNDYELKTNETANDWSRFIAFIDQVNNSGTAFYQNMQDNFDSDMYLKAWVLNNLFVNLDSYLHLAHNYYIYDDSLTGKFRWITWDVSIVFGAFPTWFSNPPDQTDITHMFHPMTSRPLHLNFYRTPEFASAYYSYMCDFLYSELAAPRLFPVIDSLAGRIRADVYAEPEENRMFTTEEFEKNLGYEGVNAFLMATEVPGLKDFIKKRRTSVIRQMCFRNYSCYLRELLPENKSEELLLIPNPVSGTVTLRFGVPSEDQDTELLIADVLGRIVFRQQIPMQPGQMEIPVNLTGMQQGIYFVRTGGPCRDITRLLMITEEK
ncbi:MAG: CotH kinase family protein [Bacteroidia bacterium]|nr:CotH kinase family protein [Bacteroidia bacterium]